MAQIPVIIISSACDGTGKTTLALNLAAALWADGFEVGLIASRQQNWQNFLQKRRALCQENHLDLPFPQILDSAQQMLPVADKKQVIIADIAAGDNPKYAALFETAHTLITVAARRSDLDWEFNHPYANLIWQVRKSAAVRGVKYLNWILVQNQLTAASNDFADVVASQAKRFGFRVATPLHFREAFCHIQDGFCAADMLLAPQFFKMTMADVYARREILTLTDFLWKNN
ncbi:MAG: hypothetical protein IJ824_02610 [Alphaproteobacteria bacterium]|nr:hypothetical protein [Alphaproteobacteria bacterium]